MGEARVVLSFARDEGHSRQSEGDFLRLKDGSIIFIYTRFIGQLAGDGRPAELVKRISTDNGETWSKPEVVIRAERFNCQNVMSVSLLRMANGDLGLFFTAKVVPTWGSKFILARSKDEGKTFNEFYDASHEFFFGRGGANNSRVERLSNGRIVFPMSHHPGSKKEPLFEGHKPRTSPYTMGTMMYSDDDGYTWHQSEDWVFPNFTNTEKGLQEGEIVEIRPGILKMFLRSDKMYQYEAVSYDNGIHWSTPTPSIFTSNCSPITICKNPYTNKRYAIWNPQQRYNGRECGFVDSGRTPFAIAEVDDTINNIIKMKYIEDDPDHAYSYAATFFTKDDELLLGYCSGGPEDRHSLSRMSIAKIDLNIFSDESKKEKKKK